MGTTHHSPLTPAATDQTSRTLPPAFSGQTYAGPDSTSTYTGLQHWLFGICHAECCPHFSFPVMCTGCHLRHLVPGWQGVPAIREFLENPIHSEAGVRRPSTCE